MESIHKTVLLNETIEGLNLKDKAIVIDGTFGGGGHSKEICNRYKNIKIIAIDEDQSAWERAKSKFTDNTDSEISFTQGNFKNLDEILKSKNIKEVDGIILDLGLSSDQLENSGRGFSFMKDEELLMTMKENPSLEDITAKDVVNNWSEENLADIIYGYGEERYAKRIARAISEARAKKEIERTFELVKIIENAVPEAYKRGKIHFATKTFQALRIAVNDELETLKVGLEKGFNVLKKNGRMSVISFHSLEDRIVKNCFREKKRDGVAKLINKKPITASKEELQINNRSRSAKLRILEKI
ncbi:MAG TPA: 16S rRNA (cytosine(1402)-N(4))-methyltransferase RsmH [Candidatus Paceibacterota bacterium]|nr:16S rRNA (cytosine(1402)-N(4))-methyltransferase RsmH [Candidatus Paceibacterota bacterium]HPT17826.1 16S rRNA (cytosine(1402)-N(4))-methyltransferase RsmH [Candidatus Paceibacterota bacterium]